MKILFICGSLEPGKDGVGDYTRRLASELIIQGNRTQIIAINDKFLQTSWSGHQTINNINVAILRLPFSKPWKLRLQTVKKIISDFNPDWLSLQFVLFSFHDKGLPFGLAHKLKRISGFRKWHIMFHELWVGMDKQSSVKYKFWGAIQRQLIKSVLTTLQPTVVHTQTKLYQQLLNGLGGKAVYLPLFGNIQVCRKMVESEPKVGRKTISLILFGGIHYGAPVKQFLQEAAYYSSETACNVSLTFIGRCGSEVESWIKECTSAGLSIDILGEQEPGIISSMLNNADYGIATTPPALIEKSGSVAAMREHGLPIICIARPWEPRYEVALNLPGDVFLYTQGNLGKIFTIKKITSVPATVSSVAEQFANDLN